MLATIARTCLLCLALPASGLLGAALGDLPQNREIPGKPEQASTQSAGRLTFALPFSDHMVLQRDVAVPVWGLARPGANVIVTFGQQHKQATADDTGQWRINLDALPAQAVPSELTVRSQGETVVLRDVLVGEVWLAAGQSNMEFPLRQDQSAKTELSQTQYDGLRLLNMTYAGQGVSAGSFSDADVERLAPEKFYRGNWAICSPRTAGGFSAVGYYFGKDLHEKLKVPVGIINLSVGGSPAEAWIAVGALEAECDLLPMVTGNWLENPTLDPWCCKRASDNLQRAQNAGATIARDALGVNHPFKPGFLWTAGMARLAPLAVRGFLWYQGESNAETADRVRQHAKLFAVLVGSWRKAWKNDSLPFLYVQLPGMNRPNWPAFRDQQRRLLATIPHAGMAVTIDLGAADNVHPRNKKPVGERLARLAQAIAYEHKVEASGPLFRETVRDGNRLVVRFDHAEGLCTIRNEPPVGFELAGEDGKFVPAVAQIKSQTVVLSAEGVKEPVHARYGWQPFPNPPLNLVNGAALPASPFTSVPEEQP